MSQPLPALAELHKIRPAFYWMDFLASAAVGWTAFAAAVYRACPGMPLERLVAADSDAAAMLVEASKNVGQWCLPYGDGSFPQHLAQASLHFNINDLQHSEI